MKSGIIPFECKKTSCPAYATCDLTPTQVRVSAGTDKEEEVVLFLSDAIGRQESSSNLPFQGKAGDFLRKTLKKLNTRKVTIAYSSLARYWPRDENGERNSPDPKAIEDCRSHLQKDIEKLKPNKIVLLGSRALKALFPDAPPISKVRGQHFEHPELGKLFVTYDPNMVLNKQNLFYQWESDLQLMLSSDKLVAKNDRWAKPYTYRILDTIEGIENYVEELLSNKDLKIIAVDTETKNLNARYDNVLGTIQICENGKRGTVIPYHHPKAGWWPDELERLDAALHKLFTTPNPPWKYWVFHNASFDYRMFFNFSLGIVKFNRPLMDTGMMSYCQDENRGKSGIDRPYSLDSLLRDYLKVKKYEDPEIERIKKQGKLLEIEIDRLAKYGASDAVYTFRLFFYILERAKREGYKDKLLKLCEHWFEPVSRMNSIMQSNGFWVDMEQLRKLRNPKTSPIVERMKEIDNTWKTLPTSIEANRRLIKHELGGKMRTLPKIGKDAWVFSLDKVEHKLCLFFDVMELEPLDFGKATRTPKVDVPEGQEVKPTAVGKLDKAFQERYGDVEEVALYKEYQGLKKLKTSYVKSIFEFLDPKSGKEGYKDMRVRPSFWVTTTDTGRSSCTSPNLQQVPRSDNWAKKEIKNMFAAEPDCALIQLDFMTSEVRWWGILSQCPSLAKAFENGKKAREDYKNKSASYVRKNPEVSYSIIAVAEKMISDTFELKSKNELNELKGKFPSKSLKIAYRLLTKDQEFFELIKAKVWAGVAGDLHKNTASRMYQVPLLEVTKSMRNDTKAIVFGTMFGRGPKAIAAQLKLNDISEVQKRIRNFFDQFPDAEDWMYDSEKLGEENAYVESPIGRRRRLLTFQMGIGDDMEVARAKRIARNCVDTETEILTCEGWKSVENIRVGDKVYTKNKDTGEVEIQPILKINRGEYVGKAHVIDRPGFSSVSTPNHRWLVNKRYGADKKIKTDFMYSEDLPSHKGSDVKIHRTANPVKQHGSGLWTDAEVEFLGWWFTDGSIKRYGADKKPLYLTIHQSERANPEKVARIDKLFKAMDLHHLRSVDTRSNCIKWETRNSSEIGIKAKLFRDKVLSKAPNKILTAEILNDLSMKQLRILYDNMLLGDGCWDANAGRYRRFVSGSKEQADGFSMLCFLLGISHNIRYRDMSKQHQIKSKLMDNIPNMTGVWLVEINKRDFAHTGFGASWKFFDGEMWCPTVENGTWFARRKGTTYWTGNSPIQGISSDGAFLGASMFSDHLIETGKWHVHPDKNCWLLQDVVHDSLVLQTPLKDVPEALKEVEPFFSTKLMKRMEDIWSVPFNIPLEVDFEIGLKWGDLTPWDGTELHLTHLMQGLEEQNKSRNLMELG